MFEIVFFDNIIADFYFIQIFVSFRHIEKFFTPPNEAMNVLCLFLNGEGECLIAHPHLYEIKPGLHKRMNEI